MQDSVVSMARPPVRSQWESGAQCRRRGVNAASRGHAARRGALIADLDHDRR
jgi:hypothetical protein